MKVREFRIGATTVRVGPSWTVTVLPDCSEVPAHPCEENLVQARYLGYGDDVERMTRHHDLLHTRLAFLVTGEASLSLRSVAGDRAADLGLAGLEEAAVMALQRYALAVAPEWLDG